MQRVGGAPAGGWGGCIYAWHTRGRSAHAYMYASHSRPGTAWKGPLQVGGVKRTRGRLVHIHVASKWHPAHVPSGLTAPCPALSKGVHVGRAAWDQSQPCYAVHQCSACQCAYARVAASPWQRICCTFSQPLAPPQAARPRLPTTAPSPSPLPPVSALLSGADRGRPRQGARAAVEGTRRAAALYGRVPVGEDSRGDSAIPCFQRMAATEGGQGPCVRWVGAPDCQHQHEARAASNAAEGAHVVCKANGV